MALLKKAVLPQGHGRPAALRLTAPTLSILQRKHNSYMNIQSVLEMVYSISHYY